MVEMTGSIFEIEYDRLLSALDKMTALLRRHGERFWAEWLEADRAKISTGDSNALDHLLSAFGGTGSFNDLVIHPSNGHLIGDGELSPVNAELGDCRAAIWVASRAMR